MKRCCYKIGTHARIFISHPVFNSFVRWTRNMNRVAAMRERRIGQLQEIRNTDRIQTV
jgi:hypothetical protein